MTVDSIAKLIADYGATAVIAGIAIAFLWRVLGSFSDWIRQRLHAESGTATFSRGRPKNFVCPGLCFRERRALDDHFFFTSADNLRASEIPRITCGCDGRTLLFQDMIGVVLREWRQLWSSFLSEYSVEQLNKLDVYALGRIMTTRYNSWRGSLRSRLLAEAIPALPVGLFVRWTDGRLEALRESTQMVSTADFYFDNSSRVAAVLSVQELAMHLTVLDLHIVISTLNGQLDGMEYRGKRILPFTQLLAGETIPDRRRSSVEPP